MFNLLVMCDNWRTQQGNFTAGRIFEYTKDLRKDNDGGDRQKFHCPSGLFIPSTDKIARTVPTLASACYRSSKG